MAIQRINTRKDRAKRDAVVYSDSQIEHYLFLLIYSGRHDTAESLFGELRRMLPGVDPNDPIKTIFTLQMAEALLLWIPLFDATDADDGGNEKVAQGAPEGRLLAAGRDGRR